MPHPQSWRDQQHLTPETVEQFAIGRTPALHPLGVRLQEIGDRWVTLRLDWKESLVGNPETGALMGGVITTVIDQASGISAALATRGRKPPEATLDLRVDYLKPSRRGSALCIRAECHKTTRRIAFIRATVWHADDPDDLVATSVATFMLTEPAQDAS